MSPLRPDLVDCWVFRVVHSARDVPSTEVLLLRRAQGRILPGLWQCVSGSLEADDRVAIGALRELHDRMPIILAPNDYAQWLDPAIEDCSTLAHLLQPGGEDELVTDPVSTRVNRVTDVEDPQCILPLFDG